MGGSDEPSNLVELSVEDHAEEHRKLFVEHGKQEDFMAWHMLKGQMDKDEALTMARSIGGSMKNRMSPEGKARMIASKKGIPLNQVHRKKIAKALTGKVRTAEHAKNNRDSRIHSKEFKEWHNAETKKRISETMKKQVKKKCPHCDKVMGVSNLAYHIKRKHGETND